MFKGDSGEKCSLQHFWRITLASSQKSIVIKWDKKSLYITAGLEIIPFARVFVNFKLSVNDEIVTYGIMIKILATLKSPVPRDAI